eukprot:3873925-Ditylum_brightwellii.AAC.1
MESPEMDYREMDDRKKDYDITMSPTYEKDLFDSLAKSRIPSYCRSPSPPPTSKDIGAYRHHVPENNLDYHHRRPIPDASPPYDHRVQESNLNNHRRRPFPDGSLPNDHHIGREHEASGYSYGTQH